MLTGTRLRNLLTYDPRTGVFRWKVDRNSRRSAGDIAGAIDRRSMDRLIRVDGRLYLARRLAWLYMKGTWPKHRINCINGDRSDIRWANLREITFAQQQASRPVQSRLGVKGVWITRQGKYVAEIRVAGQKTYLGCFETKDEANAAYLKAAKKAFGSFATAR
jgi:HNH endonuclease